MIGDVCEYGSGWCCKPPAVTIPLVCSAGTTDAAGTCCRYVGNPCVGSNDCCPANSDGPAAACQSGTCCHTEGAICGLEEAEELCCAGLICVPSADPDSQLWYCASQGG